MKLEEIGFYTLSDERAANSDPNSPYYRCELILTDRCNFKCPYCRGVRDDCKGTLSYAQAEAVVDEWIDGGLKNVRFSGGEPTLVGYLPKLVRYCKAGGVERVAISTNGSASRELYKELIDAGVDDFSVSLDACCASEVDKMAGIGADSGMLFANIHYLASQVYTTVGIVVNEDNIESLKDTIIFADYLGVADIRVISAAQTEDFKEEVWKKIGGLPYTIVDRHPILSYRANNLYDGKDVRGLGSMDSSRCFLVEDDMAVAGGYHFPCIIYLREGGDPIGKVGPDMRAERLAWSRTHSCQTDSICKKNCLDVCVDYNNRARALRYVGLD